MMKCIICGSDRIDTRDTIISDFVMARIDPNYELNKINRKTKLCFCRNCTFAFYEYRFTEEEETNLYKNYRDSEYQKTREKYECWYTAKVNETINRGVEKQQENIRKIVTSHVRTEIKVALDYGGNEGATFFRELGTEKKIVYDISGVKPLRGLIGISSFEQLLNIPYDFIMCNMVFEHLVDPYDVLNKLYLLGTERTVYYIEVPSENPFISGNKFSILQNLSLLLDKNYSWIRLAKYYFQQKKQPFMPMKEHINFFTKQSIEVMAEKGGFTTDDIQENRIGNSRVLSMLFRKGRSRET